MRQVGNSAARHHDLPAVRVASHREIEVPVAGSEEAVRGMHEHDAHAVHQVEQVAPRRPANGIVEAVDADVAMGGGELHDLLS